jgi:hypothetical protein
MKEENQVDKEPVKIIKEDIPLLIETGGNFCRALQMED